MIKNCCTNELYVELRKDYVRSLCALMRTKYSYVVGNIALSKRNGDLTEQRLEQECRDVIDAATMYLCDYGGWGDPSARQRHQLGAQLYRAL